MQVTPVRKYPVLHAVQVVTAPKHEPQWLSVQGVTVELMRQVLALAVALIWVLR